MADLGNLTKREFFVLAPLLLISSCVRPVLNLSTIGHLVRLNQATLDEIIDRGGSEFVTQGTFSADRGDAFKEYDTKSGGCTFMQNTLQRALTWSMVWY